MRCRLGVALAVLALTGCADGESSSKQDQAKANYDGQYQASVHRNAGLDEAEAARKCASDGRAEGFKDDGERAAFEQGCRDGAATFGP